MRQEHKAGEKLFVAPAERASLIAQATSDRVVRPVSRDNLQKNVVRKDDDVFIDGIPMVDQGQKGYCVNAAASRVFNYYGIPLTQHEVAQMADPVQNPIPGVGAQPVSLR